MKAITLHQPWASLVVQGQKRYETQSWGTSYRGRLAIHAGQKEFDGGPGYDRDFLQALMAAFGVGALRVLAHIDGLPRGAVIGEANLVNCRAVTEGLLKDVRPSELALGNFCPGRFMWVLDGAEAYESPIPARGSQGLWSWTKEVPA